MRTATGRASARLALTCALAAALACALPHAAPAASSTVKLKLDARKGMRAVSTPKPLKRGSQYIATVQGTFAYYGHLAWTARKPCGPFVRPMYPSPGVKNTFVGTDAEFTFALPGSEKEDCAGLPYRFSDFQISTAGRFTHVTPIGGPPSVPDPQHRYRYLLAGKGKRARFRLRDAWTKDNYGVARITVRPAPKGFTAPAPAPVPAPAPPVPPAT